MVAAPSVDLLLDLSWIAGWQPGSLAQASGPWRPCPQLLPLWLCHTGRWLPASKSSRGVRVNMISNGALGQNPVITPSVG